MSPCKIPLEEYLEAIARDILLLGKTTISNWILSGHFKFSYNYSHFAQICWPWKVTISGSNKPCPKCKFENCIFIWWALVNLWLRTTGFQLPKPLQDLLQHSIYYLENEIGICAPHQIICFNLFPTWIDKRSPFPALFNYYEFICIESAYCQALTCLWCHLCDMPGLLLPKPSQILEHSIYYLKYEIGICAPHQIIYFNLFPTWLMLLISRTFYRIVYITLNANLWLRFDVTYTAWQDYSSTNPSQIHGAFSDFAQLRFSLDSNLNQAESEPSQKCEHPTARIEAQLRGSNRIRAEPCSHCWLGSDLSEPSPNRAQCEKAQ